jgi:hypothetical protein
MKGRRIEGEKVRSSKMRLKASIPYVHTNSNRLYDILHFVAFSADSIQSKKPSVGPKGLIGPPCHGAPGRRRRQGNLLCVISYILFTTWAIIQVILHIAICQSVSQVC